MPDASSSALDRAWRTPRPPGRPGPRPAHSLDAIVEVAVRLADRGGVDAVTLGRVATELGLTTNALYGHVGSRDELRALAHDATLGPPPRGLGRPVAGSGWEEGVRGWVVSLRQRYVEHPWLLDVLVRIPVAPHALAWLDDLLGVLRGAGLAAEERLHAASLIDGFVRSSAAADRDLAADGTDDVDPTRLLPLVRDRGLSEVAAVLEAGLYRQEVAGADLELGLSTVIAGLRRPPTGPASGPRR